MSKKQEINIAGSVTPTVEVAHISKDKKDLSNARLKELMADEGRLVRGIFQCFEQPGATQKITYKKYPTKAEMRKRGSDGGLEPFSKAMTDGQEYEIPLYVARFLNGTDVSAGALDSPDGRNTKIGSCSYVVHGFKSMGEGLAPSSLDDAGIPVPIVGVVKRVKRYGFQSLEFASGAA